MKTKKEAVLPSPSKGNKGKKIANRTKKRSLYMLSTILAFIGFIILDDTRKQIIYDNLDISFKEIKEVEYGTANYDPMTLVKSTIDGQIVNYTEKVDTTKLGKQEVVFEVAKDDVVKEIKVDVEVKDTKAPDISLKDEKITITQGEEFDITKNIESVADVVDGDINYSKEETDNANYTVSTNLDKNKPGDYNVTVKATDANGNQVEKTYTVKVNAKPVVQTYAPVNYTTKPSNIDTSSVVSAANSLLGIRYTAGGTNPSTGFDCSGFVKYVYGLLGVNLSGGSNSQLTAGQAVSENNMQAGDIIIWANNGSNYAAHSSIYDGSGNIIHATTNRGVQKTNLNSWKTWGQHIIGIRRV